MTGTDLDLDRLTLTQAAARLADGSLRSADLIEACLARIDALSGALNAFIAVTDDEARQMAAEADAAQAAGHSRGLLHGLPIALKDLIDQQGRHTTAGSRVLDEAPVAAADAPVTARLRAAGAVLVGRCNLHEFALGPTSQDSAYGPVLHPQDPTRLAGGSSGGSAVAVATGMALAAIGTDTAGSVRMPAAACGLVGLKPAYGEVPLEGIVPLSPSLDHVGPLCRSVEDAWRVHAVLAALPDEQVAAPEPGRLSSLRAGVLRGYFTDILEDEVRDRVDAAIRATALGGARLREVTIADAEAIGPTYAAIALAEACTWHAPYLASRGDRYTPAVRERLEAGQALTAVEYLQAQARRERLRREVEGALDDCDILLLPTLPSVAPPEGQARIAFGERDLPVRAAMLRLTQLFNLTGHPAITLPCGASNAGLPIGLQVVARDTRTLVGWARAIEGWLGQGHRVPA